MFVLANGYFLHLVSSNRHRFTMVQLCFNHSASLYHGSTIRHRHTMVNNLSSLDHISTLFQPLGIASPRLNFVSTIRHCFTTVYSASLQLCSTIQHRHIIIKLSFHPSVFLHHGSTDSTIRHLHTLFQPFEIAPSLVIIFCNSTFCNGSFQFPFFWLHLTNKST